MTILKLRDKSNSIQLTPNEALQSAIDTEFKKTHVMVLLFDDNHRDNKTDPYEFWQGGGVINSEVLWHIEQYKSALLAGRIKVF